MLINNGYSIKSETDTEVIANLLAYNYNQNEEDYYNNENEADLEE